MTGASPPYVYAARDERHAAFILFSYFHAARRKESLALRGTDVVNGSVRIVRVKQRKNPIVNVQPVHAREKELLTKYAALAGDGRVFPYSAGYASRMVQSYIKQAGAYTFARTKSLHSLRHSAGTNLYRGSKDIVAVATYLGHKSIESSRRYVAMSASEVNALAAAAL